MATERQIAANRRNSRKSTGPRTIAGKRRMSRNAYRHGLASGVAATTASAKNVETLAHKIAGIGADAVTLEHARSAAQAEFDLAQIRRVRVAMLQVMSECGQLEVPELFWTFRGIKRALNAIDRGQPLDPHLNAPSPPEMPSSEPEHSAKAVLRALPELLKLESYERRAAGRRDRAVRCIKAGRLLGLQSKVA
jgi:hypothetical protein